MSDRNEGGPAFPVQTFVGEQACSAQAGMSLRDYFAATALQGLLSSMAHPASIGSNLEGYPQSAAHAYEIADAMLKAREQ